MASDVSDRSDSSDKEIFDSIIVVTDRRVLDDQIQRTIKQFMQVSATVGHAGHSGDLRRFIEQGRKIIISTVQKFPFILDEIQHEAGKTFAIIIDEAHSSQGGKTSSAMHKALGDRSSAEAQEDEADAEDIVNAALDARMASRRMLTNASYFAFTATPKAKTLEMFGEALPPDAEGRVRHRPFHSYTMKQAIDEGFILDVLGHYTPVDSYYKLVKRVEADPEFDTKKAQKKLRRYVEGHEYAIRLKAEIIEKKAALKIPLSDADAEIAPAPADGARHKPQPELDRLSNILKAFNEHFGTLFTDADRVARRIRDDIAPKVAADIGYQNARLNTPPPHRPHGARPGSRQDDAVSAQGRHPGLQAVRRERVVPALCGGYGVRVDGRVR
jgi:type I site-specific restriction-modification system R (restriction) subunit